MLDVSLDVVRPASAKNEDFIGFIQAESRSQSAKYVPNLKVHHSSFGRVALERHLQ
jgi:hypothetical protein